MNFISLILSIFLLIFTIFIVGTLIIDLYNYFHGTGPYVASSKEFISNLFIIYTFKKSNHALDLGSGDGRILMELAKRGIKAKGYEINPFLVLITNIILKLRHLSSKAVAIQKDFLKTDISEHDVVILFGLKALMPKIEKKFLSESKKGTVLISNKFQLPNIAYTKKLDKTYLYVK